MSVLIWKELRENIRWALLAMFLLGAAEIYGLYPANTQDSYYGYNGVTLTRTGFLTITTFGCAAVGFVLGLIQILPELRRDQWAALLHRPVSRGTVFRGKVVAGLMLYALATVPPFLFAVWFTATPGHFSAPFVPEMVLGGTVDTCMGAVYYFAALATGLQRGGWMILRAVPLLAAIHTSFFVGTENLFYVAVEAAVLMGLALFTTAWGQMLRQDTFGNRPWISRVAFLAVTFYGVCGFGELINSFTGTLAPGHEGKFVRYQLTDDGVPVRLTYGPDSVLLSVSDIDGKPMTDKKYQPERIRNHLKYLNGYSGYIGDAHGYKSYRYPNSYRSLRASMYMDNPINYPFFQQWFNITKLKYLIGYNPTKKLPFAILDQNGFEPVTAVPVPFTPDTEIGYVGQGVQILWTPKSARFAFIGEQKILDVVLPGPGPIFGTGHAWANKGQASIETCGLALLQGMAVYNDKGEQVAYLPYRRDVSQWGAIQLGLNADLNRFWLWYEPSAFLPDEKKKGMPSYVDVVDAQGKVVQTYTLPSLPPDAPRTRSWPAFISSRLQTPASFFGMMLYRKVAGVMGNGRLAGDLAWQFKRHYKDTIENCIWIPIIAAVLGSVAYIWARRNWFSPRRALAWATFSALLGLPGLITFRLCADWPRQVPCPSCGVPRPIDTARCPKCGAGWPDPKATGVEIFDRPRHDTEAVASV